MRNLIIGVSIAITLVVNFSVHAEAVYKWIDEDGQIHYSSKPNSKHAKEVKMKKRSTNTNKSSEMTTEERVNQQNRFLNALDVYRLLSDFSILHFTNFYLIWKIL